VKNHAIFTLIIFLLPVLSYGMVNRQILEFAFLWDLKTSVTNRYNLEQIEIASRQVVERCDLSPQRLVEATVLFIGVIPDELSAGSSNLNGLTDRLKLLSNELAKATRIPSQQMFVDISSPSLSNVNDARRLIGLRSHVSQFVIISVACGVR
jgi:hypothetical protein